MRHLRGIVFLLAVLLLLAACGEEDPPATEPPAGEPIPTSNVATPTGVTPVHQDALDDTWWRLTAMGDRSGEIVELVTLGVTGDVMQGTGGCNTYELTFSTTPDGVLELSEPIKSATSCPLPHGVMAIEEEFFTRLDQVTGYELADDRLTLRNAAGDPLLDFMVDARILLDQTSWTVVSLNDEPFGDSESTTIWFYDYAVQVSTPCHMAFLRNWESNEVSTMSFGELDFADSFCPEDASMPDERGALLDGLLEITTMRKIGQEQMELSNDDRSIVILLQDTSWSHPSGLLQGTRWVLMSLHGEPLPPDLLVFMMIGVNGTYGMAGCIEGFPGAELLPEGSVRPHNRPYLNEERCGPDGPDDVSKAIVDAAESSKRHVHLPGRLEMLDGDGEAVLIFRQVPTETELSETQWIPVTIGGMPVIGDTDISLSFTGVWMSISDGCNGGGGEYMVPVPGRMFATEFSTEDQGCDEIVPGEAAQRDRYLLISRASRYQLTATTLELYDDQGNSLAEFEAKIVRYGLEDTRWNLTTMNGAPVHEDTGTTLQFIGWGAGGWGSCNEYILEDLHFDRDTIGVSGIGRTEEGCPDFPEQEYFDTLETVERYQLVGDRLVLLNASGQSILGYRLDWDITALSDTDWSAVTILGERLEEAESVIFSFAGNQVNVWPGCMQIQFGGFGIDGSRISMSGPYFSSAENCDFTAEGYPEGVPLDATESITSIAGYRFIEGNQLELVNNAGETLFVLEPVEGQ